MIKFHVYLANLSFNLLNLIAKEEDNPSFILQ